VNLLGIVFALASALVWGGGDFSGGLATRRNSPFQVLALSSLSGLVVLAAFALLYREPFPQGRAVVLALLAGIAGAVGLAALYQGLAAGSAAVVAPTSGVLGAAVPVAYSVWQNGAPAALQLAGFAAALLGIVLVSRPVEDETSRGRQGFPLAMLAGLGFGVFFILIAEAGRQLVFTPLILARGVEFSIAALMLLASRLRFPSARANPIALLAGVLDGGGNALYVLAGQFVPLGVAAVLASFYPAATVALSSIILKERVAPGQRAGVALCLAAIVLISVSH
jgi:drug/metabolite transporter (DMT)-like permease